jgi:integrase
VIVKRGQSYGVSVYDPGTKRKRWVGTFSTLRTAREAEREAGRGARVTRGITCAGFADRWLVEYARPAAATRSSYRYALKRFRADWGGMRLAEVARPEARAWSLLQPQSNVRVARAMFSDAINDGLHPGPNPFAGLRLEQPRGRKDLDALTEAEVYRLADCAIAVHGSYGQTFRAMILFAAYVGLRPGELFALERSDLDADLIRIRRSLDGTGRIKLPKNNRERIVVLPPPAREALRHMPTRADLPWVFATARGRRFSQGSLTYCWRPVRAAFGRPQMDFYELRHFCATHLLELGVSHADVAVQLGHRDGGRLVMSTYGHPSEDGARERLKRAYVGNIAAIRTVGDGSQSGSKLR